MVEASQSPAWALIKRTDPLDRRDAHGGRLNFRQGRRKRVPQGWGHDRGKCQRFPLADFRGVLQRELRGGFPRIKESPPQASAWWGTFKFIFFILF